MNTDHADSAPAEHRHAPHTAPVQRAADNNIPTDAHPARYTPALLASPAAAGRANAPVRAAVLQRMQHTYGNRAVQRFLAVQRAPGDPGGTTAPQVTAPAVQRDGPAPATDAGPAVPADNLPAGPVWDPTKRVTPTFPVTHPPAKRSNSDPSTTTHQAVTFTGAAAVDARAKVWRYQLTAVNSPGTIQLVYYDADHYPAPTPTDDSGALSNVTEANWKTIVKDLKDNRSGIPKFWSAYQRESLHENYHWEHEWQGQIKPAVQKAEDDIAKLQVDFAGAASAADAEAALKPRATTIFDAAIQKGVDAYDALGDSPGDPPYVAQAPGLDALRGRVEKYATDQKWTAP